MKLSMVFATVAMAVPGLAGIVTTAPEITGVINHGHRQPFKPLSKNGTTHGLVNATGLAVPTGGPVRGVWRPFADKPIETLDCSKTGVAVVTSMTVGATSKTAPSMTQVPSKKLPKGKRDAFKKTEQKNGGNNGHQEGNGTDKKKINAPHKIDHLPADFGTKSLGGKKPWSRPSSGVPKNAGRKFKEALAAKKAKTSPQAPWTKTVDHGNGNTSSIQSDRKAKTIAGVSKVHGRKFKEALAAKKAKATGNRPVSSTGVHNGKDKATNSQHSAGQPKIDRLLSVNNNNLSTGKKTKTPRRSLAHTPETISPDNLSHPIHRRTSDTPFGIKKGLAYNNGAVTTSFSRDGSATWAYNWGATPGAPMFQQIPMFWGPGIKGDMEGVMARVREGAPWVLGYNEPDMVGQSGGCEVSAREACKFLMPFFGRDEADLWW